MGTEILRPQDCLMRPAPGFLPRRRCSANLSHKFFRKEPSPLPESRRRREGSPRQAKPRKPVIGQVTILKRGQIIDERAAMKYELRAGSSGCEGASGALVFEAGRLGPEPAMIPKQIRLVCSQEEAGEDGYAGSAFSMSPSPRSLPLPSFSRREDASAQAAVDESATMGLRRLLRLEQPTR